MHRTGYSLLCPLKTLHHIYHGRRELEQVAHEHLCAGIQSIVISREVKKIAVQAGVPATKYSTHSIRRGSATALLSGAANSLSIKLLWCWMSSCFEDYPVPSMVASLHLSARMVSPPPPSTPRAS
ncbi:hypothetical protein PybrP1_003290 [[Pythium] brassicae (nom. inval.)]|nr:hypothetical protein PybrP1_003290 [[Pythium] brassicae (nom. inval.)]